MDIKQNQDTLTIDPIAMNIVNRVAAGSRLSGPMVFDGGLLVQGDISGDIQVNGRLIVEIAWGADLAAAEGTWSWTDVTSDVRQADRIALRHGRGDAPRRLRPAR